MQFVVPCCLFVPRVEQFFGETSVRLVAAPAGGVS